MQKLNKYHVSDEHSLTLLGHLFKVRLWRLKKPQKTFKMPKLYLGYEPLSTYYVIGN